LERRLFTISLQGLRLTERETGSCLRRPYTRR